MSTVRVFELAREYGIDSKELIDRIHSIGITAADHLTALDGDSVDKVRELLASAPSGAIVEKRVNRTVRRRRSRRSSAGDAPETTAVENVQEASVEAPPEEALPVPEATPKAVEIVEELSVVEPAEEAHPPATVDAPAVVEEAVVAEVAPAASEAVAPDAVVVEGDTVEGSPEGDDSIVLPTSPEGAPSMQQAVIVTSHVNQRVAEAVAKTRAQKGYDGTEPANTRSSENTRSGGGPPTPGALGPDRDPRAAAEQRKKKGTGRRLVYDKRRDHLLRRGMLDHDDIFRGGRGKKKRKAKRGSVVAPPTIMKEAKRVVKMGEAITVGELAQAMMVKSTEVIQKLMSLGEMATVNQAIDFDTASMVAEEFTWRVESIAFDVTDYVEETAVDDSDLVSRPPVVTVMGHVDHGKTSLLDHIRNTRVTDGEAGGITQHIGAYRVNLEEKGTVVFIDTPGHEAFTAMRARGAKATDLVILVVAADDGVMPQTIEAINHAQAADVPIVVACNKIDKANANTEKVISELSEHGLVSEEWGGDTVICMVSALKGEGIEHLLEMVLLQAELLELKGNSKKPARGLVLEGRLEKGRGPVATVLVQEGTLTVGDTIVSSTVSGRIRALHDDMGNKVESAGPSMPVEVLGLSGVPEASEEFLVVKDDRAAGKIVGHRVAESRLAAQAKNRPTVSLDNLHEMLEAGEVHELKIIVKSDVHGSGEALAESLEKLSHPEVKVNVIHNAVGGVTESDINLAAASDAIVIGFGVRPAGKAKALADKEKVDVKLYTIIYEALEEVRAAMAGMLAPVEREKDLGVAEVREVFSIPKIGNIAGCSITEGLVHRNARIRVVRDSVQMYDGVLSSLRRFKENVKEVKQGYECGIGIANFNDIKVGDMLEAYEIEKIAATLD